MVVDHEAIPGFMGAMAMPYPVADPKLLDAANPGDQITADVVLPEGKPPHLENIVVVQKGESNPGSSLQAPVPGQVPPNFEFVNQDGKKVQLHQYRASSSFGSATG
jgi:protein SCO1/2